MFEGVNSPCVWYESRRIQIIRLMQRVFRSCESCGQVHWKKEGECSRGPCAGCLCEVRLVASHLHVMTLGSLEVHSDSSEIHVRPKRRCDTKSSQRYSTRGTTRGREWLEIPLSCVECRIPWHFFFYLLNLFDLFCIKMTPFSFHGLSFQMFLRFKGFTLTRMTTALANASQTPAMQRTILGNGTHCFCCLLP